MKLKAKLGDSVVMGGAWLFTGREHLAGFEQRCELLRIPEISVRIRNSQKLIDHFGLKDSDLFSLMQAEENPFLIDETLSSILLNAVQVGLFERFIRLHGRPKMIIGDLHAPFSVMCAAGIMEFSDSVELTYLWKSISRLIPKASLWKVSPTRRGERAKLLNFINEWGLDIVSLSYDGSIMVNVPETELNQFKTEWSSLGARISLESHLPHPQSLGAVRELHKFFENVQINTFRSPQLDILDPYSGKIMNDGEKFRQWIWNVSTKPFPGYDLIENLASRGLEVLEILGKKDIEPNLVAPNVVLAPIHSRFEATTKNQSEAHN